MPSLYLNRLSTEERTKLEHQLWSQQAGKCFISGKDIDLQLSETDIDHIVPLRDSGKDGPSNLALTLSHYNRSKQASNLRVARVLSRLDTIRETTHQDDRGANLGDVLLNLAGKPQPLRMSVEEDKVKFILASAGDVEPHAVPIYTEPLSKMRYFFALLPIRYLHHDNRINPRPIGNYIRGLIEEFYRARPQLHIALGWVDSSCFPSASVRIFDGQHKAAAQILLGVKELPVRIFIDPDIQVLLTTNTNAGTTLRQIAFDKSVQRRLGSAILLDRIVRYKTGERTGGRLRGIQ